MFLKSSELMSSENYKERFIAEYNQLKYRFDGLKRMLEKWDNGTLTLHRLALAVFTTCRLKQ